MKNLLIPLSGLVLMTCINACSRDAGSRPNIIFLLADYGGTEILEELRMLCRDHSAEMNRERESYKNAIPTLAR